MIRVQFSKTEHELLVTIGKLRHAVTSALGTERKQDPLIWGAVKPEVIYYEARND